MNQKRNDTADVSPVSRPAGRRLGRFLRPLAIVVAVATLAAACGDDDETEAGSGSNDDFESPLADYMGFDGFESDPEVLQAQVNDSIVECMQAEGFEYIPRSDNVFTFGEEAGSDGLIYGSDEWVEKYGLGFSTQAFPQDTVGPDLVGSDDSFFFGSEDDDPNAAYVESLPEAEQEAYYEALWGDQDDFGPEISEDMTEEEQMAAIELWEANYEPSGCEPLAYEQVFGGESEDEFTQEFGADLEALFESFDSHPRIVEAEQATSSCMSDKGLEYTSMEDLYEELEARMEPLYDEAFNLSDQVFEEMSEEEFEALGDEERDELFAPKLSDESKALLAEIQAYEIELGVALNECGGGPEDTDALYNEVRIEMEQQFIDDNRDRLDEFKAAQGGS